MDSGKLSQVLEGFLSAQESVRKEAEAYFATLKQSNPDELASLLMQVLRHDAAVERRQQAAIAMRTLLRELFLGSDENAWVRMSLATRESLKNEFLTMAGSETQEAVRRAIGDLMSDLGGALISRKEWPELQPAVLQMMSPQASTEVQILGLNVCRNLEAHISDSLSANISELASLLQSKLATDNAALRIATIGLICQIVTNEMRRTWKVFESFIPGIMTIVSAFAEEERNTDDNTNLTEVLQKLIEVADAQTDYFKCHVKLVFDTLLNICRASELSEESKQQAAEVMLCIVDQKPKMASKVPGFLENLINVLMTFMLDIEEDRSWLERELTCEDDEEAGNYDVGEYAMDRVAAAVGGDIAMPIIFSQVSAFIQNPDWKHKVAAIVAISQTVEYLPEDKIESQLGQIISLLLSQMTDGHYRVRFAACRALGQTALDHQPFAQINFHGEVLPALIQAFEDPVARVQSQAFAAFVNYTEEVDVLDLTPLVPSVMEKLLSRLDLNFSLASDSQFSPQAVARQHRSIREQCITSVAVISGVMSESFLPYCSRIVPLMKAVVERCDGPEDRQLRGRALECLSIIAYSVGVASMEQDVVQIVTALIALYKTEMQADDPVKDYVHEALRRMVKVLGDRFAQFVPDVIQHQLGTFKVQAENVDPDSENAEDYTLVCLTSGQFAGVKTSRLEDIEKELSLVCATTECMKATYGPWVEITMQAVTPLLEMKYSDSVRRLSLVCIANLIGCAREASKPVTQISQWTLSTMASVFKCVEDEEEIAMSGVDHLSANVGGLAKCLEGAGPNVLEKQVVLEVCKKVFELIEQSSVRRAEIDAAKQDPDVDEEDAERADEEAEREQIFRETCLQVLEAIIKHHPTHFVEVGAPLTCQFIQAFVHPSRPADDRSLAIFICCDMIERLGVQGLQMIGPVFEQILVYTGDADVTVRQSSCYAVALTMDIANIDANIVHQAATRLTAVLAMPRAMEKPNRDASENAVSALLRMIQTQVHHLGSKGPEYAALVMDKLPLQADEGEAQKVHERLCESLLDVSSFTQ